MPIAMGSLLSLAGGALSDLMGSRNASKDRKLARHQFDQQMDFSIQRRVKDAQAAGVHPLFALGASAGASPTVGYGGRPTGSAVGDAVQGIGRAMAEAQLNQVNAQTRALEAQKERDHAEAMLTQSNIARLRHDLLFRGMDGANFTGMMSPIPTGAKMAQSGLPGEIAGPPEYGPSIVYPPEVPASQSTGIRAGNPPVFLKAQHPDGRTVKMFDPGLGMDEIGQAYYILQRAQNYTTDALTWARRVVQRAKAQSDDAGQMMIRHHINRKKPSQSFYSDWAAKESKRRWRNIQRYQSGGSK